MKFVNVVSVWCCFVVFILNVYDVIGVESGSTCSTFTDCTTCAQQDNCGWCPSKSSCEDESYESQCIPNEETGIWSDSESMCGAVDPTARLKTCTACAGVSNLLPGSYYAGFCPAENSCYIGYENGPLNHTCAGNETEGIWSYSTDMCNAVYPATRLLNCSVCTAAASSLPGDFYVGWCPIDKLCYVGYERGPLNHTCDANDAQGIWSYNTDMCNAVYPSTRFKNCSECAGVAHYLPGDYYTGWCGVEGKCYVGTEQQPLNHTCAPSDKFGIFSTSTSECGAVNPTERYHNCSSCVAVAGDLPGDYYTGWCPTDGMCYVGYESGPLNRTCVSDESLGMWAYNNDQCAAINPTKRLLNCTACEARSGDLPGDNYLGWCGSEQKCYLGSEKEPLNHTCKVDSNLGGYNTDCSCANPLLLGNEGSCHDCDYTFCYYGQYCQAKSDPSQNPCLDGDDCGTMCLCTGYSSNCALCKPGRTNPNAGCSDKCAPNCFDCSPTNRTACASMCRQGFTNFPECNEICPAKCGACGGSWNMTNSTVQLSSSQCLSCADPGARPPSCDQCLPYVCRGTGGACNVPCNDPTGFGNYTQIMPMDSPDYPNCDKCKDAISHIMDYAQLLQKVMNTEEEAELVGLAMELDCTILPPPLDIACGFLVTAADAGTGITWLVTWIGAQILEALASMDFCMVSRMCQYPCSPSRTSMLQSIVPPRA